MPKNSTKKTVGKAPVEWPIEWNVSEDCVARYATNMVVQRSENEFFISFFEIKPPLLLGSVEEINAKAKQIKAVQANCVAQIIVAADKMPSFVEALQKNLERTRITLDNKEE